jgi:Domain of unknown function (DUF4410)
MHPTPLLPAASLLAAFAALAEAGPQTPARKFDQIQIAPFEIAEGVEVPADYVSRLSTELVAELTKTKRFKRVLQQDEATEAGVTVARLTGTITEFKKGNRAARYFVGLGAGRTVIRANVRFTDVSSGETLLEDDVDGKVVMGGMGGASSGATNGLAKEVAKVAKAHFAQESKLR